MPEENLSPENKDINTNAEPPLTQPSGGDVIHPNSSESTTNDLGHDSSVSAPPVIEQSSEEPHTVLAIPPTSTPVKKSHKKLLIILSLLLLCVIGAATWFAVMNGKQSSKSSQKSNELAEIPSLTVGITEGPASTYFPDESLLGVYTVLNRQIYEGLVGYENNRITPLLAESWTNPDQNTWVFKIRPNVTFHTGTKVGANEVRDSLESLKEYDYWSLFVSTISSIEATGDLEVTIKTTEPDALLLNRLTHAYITDVSMPEEAGRNGTGAYIADPSAVNDETMTTLIAYDDYYGEKAKTRKLIFRIYETEEELPIALKNKEIDVMETLTYPALNKEMTEAGFGSTEYESPGVYGMYLNLNRSKTTVLLDKNVRLAVSQALDRQAIIDTLGNKNSPVTQVIPKSLPGHDPAITMPNFDVAAAKATLSKTKAATTPLEFLYIKELQTDAPTVIEQLRAAGFIIKEKAYSSSNIEAAVNELRAGRYDLFMASYISDVSDARDILGSLLHSSENSYGNYSDPVFDEMLAASDKEFDPAKRIILLQKANNYIAENLIWIPLRNGIYNSYYRKDINMKIDYTGGVGLGVYYRKVGLITE